MADDITELVRLLREKPDITSHCAASCIEGFQRKAAKVSPDPVVVRLENQVADLRNLVETATVLLKEACDSMDESVSKASDGRWYMKKMPSFINIDWQMRAIIWQANAGAKP